MFPEISCEIYCFNRRPRLRYVDAGGSICCLNGAKIAAKLPRFAQAFDLLRVLAKRRREGGGGGEKY